MSEIIKFEGKSKESEVDVMYNIKEFTRHRDVIISRLHAQGVIFYGVNINIPQQWDIKLFRHKYPEIELADKDIIMSPEEAFENLKKEGQTPLMLVLKQIDLVDLAYVVIEAHENSKDKRMLGYPHIHMLLGIRSVIGRNESLKGEILNSLMKHGGYEDIDMNELRTERDITTYWNYIVKKANYKKGGLGREAFKNHFMYIFREGAGSDLYASFLDSILMISNPLPYGFIGDCIHKHSKVNGLLKVVGSDKYILINLWRVFMQRLEIFNFNGKLYQRNFKSRYSYELLGDLSILRDKTDEILLILRDMFPMQLKYVDLPHLMGEYFDKAIESVYNNPKLLPSRKIMFNLIEFTDGIYNLSVDIFLKYNDEKHQIILKELDNNLTCVKYYGITYHNLEKPDYWLEKIGEQLGSKKKLVEFCTSFGRLFHNIPPPFEIPKRNAVMVIGESNTGKTALVSDILFELFGKENIGMIGNGGSFSFEQIVNKVVIVNDEYKYNPSTRSNALKLTEQKPFLMNSKYKRQKEFVSEAPVLLLSNERENDVLLQDDAFLNRIALFSFLHRIPEAKIDVQLQKKIKAELPSIVVYCNRLFVKKYYVARRLRIANNSKRMVEKIKGLFLPEDRKIK